MKTYRTLLLCPRRISIFDSFLNILNLISKEIITIDTSEFLNSINKYIIRYENFLPYKIRFKLKSYVLNQINNKILKITNEFCPDIIIIYNSENLLPSTCETLSEKSKLIFFLGDSPFFTPSNIYFPHILKYSHAILSPDTYWIKQINVLGYDNTYFFLPSPLFQNIKKDKKEFDLIYVGQNYINTWGYKKAKLMSNFVDFNFKLYGNKHWKKWFHIFPQLEKCYTHKKYLPIEELNSLYENSKLMPVDGNPGIINGIHFRVFEALSFNILPLIEYRSDVDSIIFNDLNIKLPLIFNYNDAKKIAEFYLKNEEERIQTLTKMKNYIFDKYSLDKNAFTLKKIINNEI